jgi:IclR family transcriptional regulator, KDG regulon repressor
MSSLENALGVLRLLSRDQPTLRVSEVCGKIGLPKSSVSRLLHTMSQATLLEREAEGRGYVAGPLAVRLGELYLARHSLLDLIGGALDRLIAEFGFTGYASVLSGSEIVLLRVRQGSYPLRHVREVGARLPAARTIMGRALLARLSNADALSRLSGSISDHAGSNRLESLLAELAEARRQRFVIAASVLTPGITSIGTALRRAGESPMALALTFPELATNSALRETMIAAVLREAAGIGQQIHDPQWAGPESGP